jgi:hypothetical protein
VIRVGRLLLLTAASRHFEFRHDAIPPATMPEVRTATTVKLTSDRYLLGVARRQVVV